MQLSIACLQTYLTSSRAKECLEKAKDKEASFSERVKAAAAFPMHKAQEQLAKFKQQKGEEEKQEKPEESSSKTLPQSEHPELDIPHEHF